MDQPCAAVVGQVEHRTAPAGSNCCGRGACGSRGDRHRSPCRQSDRRDGGRARHRLHLVVGVAAVVVVQPQLVRRGDVRAGRLVARPSRRCASRTSGRTARGSGCGVRTSTLRSTVATLSCTTTRSLLPCRAVTTDPAATGLTLTDIEKLLDLPDVRMPVRAAQRVNELAIRSDVAALRAVQRRSDRRAAARRRGSGPMPIRRGRRRRCGPRSSRTGPGTRRGPGAGRRSPDRGSPRGCGRSPR